MSLDERPRTQVSRGMAKALVRGLAGMLIPTERMILTREGACYLAVMGVLLFAGLYQQVNLILLVSTLAAGPFFTSLVGSRALLRRLSVVRRTPSYVFSGDPLVIEYLVANGRSWTPALALFVDDQLAPVDQGGGGDALAPRVFFPRVSAGERGRIRWQGTSPRRGEYRFRELQLGTRAPFGLVERTVPVLLEDRLVVYPRIGQLTRRWFQIQRQAMVNRTGQRHDRTAQQDEYHGLRDYRAGDSPRWIHWRTSARRGELMVKEFEQQNEQDLAILVDPWLPPSKPSAAQLQAVEQAISFAATVCLETCRRQGRRVLLGWTGLIPGVFQGHASIKLLHELLGQLAVLGPNHTGRLAELLDAMPAASVRDSLLVVVATRGVNLTEEAERSTRFSGSSARNFLGRVIVLNAAQGELNELIQFAGSTSRGLLEQRLPSGEYDRFSSQDGRLRGVSPAAGDPPPDTSANPPGEPRSE